MLFHQHQFSYLFTKFSSLILLVGDEKKLIFHYQLRSINLKEEKEETSTRGSPSQQTFTDKENTRISDTSSAPSVCLRPKCLSLQETYCYRSWVSTVPPKAAFTQSFGYKPPSEVQWRLLFSRNLSRKMGDFKGHSQKPTKIALSWWWEWKASSFFTEVLYELCNHGGWNTETLLYRCCGSWFFGLDTTAGLVFIVGIGIRC